MGEKVFDLVKAMALGKHSKIFWGLVIIAALLVLIVLPYVDANFFYYDRIETRINNLSSLVTISGKTLQETPQLLDEYNSILAEISSAQEKRLSIVANNAENSIFEYWVKFVSGALLFIVIGIIALVQREKNSRNTFISFLKNQLLAFILAITIAVFLGYVFAQIPVVGSVWVNAIITPILQLTIAFLLLPET